MNEGDSRKTRRPFQLKGEESVGDSIEEEIPEEIENVEKPSVSSRSKDSPTCASEKHEEAGESWHKEALEAERKTKSTLREALQKERRQKYALRKALRKEQNSNSMLSRTLQNEKAKNNGLRVEMELVAKRADHLCKMLKRQRRGYAKAVGKLRNATAQREKEEKATETLKRDLEATLHKHRREIAELERVTGDQVQKLKDQLAKMQGERVEKERQIASLLFKTQTLQQDMEAKGATVSALQEKVGQLASDGEGLRRHLETALNRRQISLPQLEESGETRGTNRGLGEKDEARFRSLCRRLRSQSKKLAEKTAALEKSLAAEERLRVSLRSERERAETMLLRNRTQVKAITVLSYEQKEAVAASDRLRDQIRSLRMENACRAAKYDALEAEYDRVRSGYRAVSERREQLASKNDDLVSEKQTLAAKLRNTEDKIRERELERGASQAQLQKALAEEKERRSESEERAARASRALREQRSVLDRRGRDLENALSAQLRLLDEKRTLRAALRDALDANLRPKKQPEEDQAAFRFNATPNGSCGDRRVPRRDADGLSAGCERRTPTSTPNPAKFHKVTKPCGLDARGLRDMKGHAGSETSPA